MRNNSKMLNICQGNGGQINSFASFTCVQSRNDDCDVGVLISGHDHPAASAI